MGRTPTVTDHGESNDPDYTEFDRSDKSESPISESSKSKRRLAGALATFNLFPQGKLFVLYEGRNLIGKAEHCDIRIAADRSLSDEHAEIVCREHRDELITLITTNLTVLNGKELGSNSSTNLDDGAKIKMGASVFEFKRISIGREKVSSGGNRDRDEYDDLS